MHRLDKSLWNAVSPLLDRALELEPALQAELLATVRADSPEIAPLLESLLAEHNRVFESDFLETPPAIHETSQSSLAGQTIGAYTLERPLGMGGMGTVWLARRSDGRFESRVAVKLMNLAALDRGSEERFKREGTLLARLAHPFIARLLDAGITAAGQPFLVLGVRRGDSYRPLRRRATS